MTNIHKLRHFASYIYSNLLTPVFHSFSAAEGGFLLSNWQKWTVKSKEEVKRMANRLKVTGRGSNISLSEQSVSWVFFDSDIAPDSNARATDYGLGIRIWGKILLDLESGGDPTLELAKWSQVPSYNADCYRRLEVEVISAGQTVRQYTLSEAFVVEYSEKLNADTGVGTFYLHARQKKDENEKVAIDGGFSAE